MNRGRTGEWGRAFVARALKISPDEAEQLLMGLREAGFIEPTRMGSGEQLYRTTVAGRALAGASAGKAIKRETADRLLAEFLNRVQVVNSDPHYLFSVVHAVVFGSYLSDAKELGDLDIAIHLERKESDWDKHVALEDTRIAEAQARGRSFRSYDEQVSWPEDEVRMFLKSRARGLSLHDLRSDARIIAAGPFRVVYPPGGSELPVSLRAHIDGSDVD